MRKTARRHRKVAPKNKYRKNTTYKVRSKTSHSKTPKRTMPHSKTYYAQAYYNEKEYNNGKIIQDIEIKENLDDKGRYSVIGHNGPKIFRYNGFIPRRSIA